MMDRRLIGHAFPAFDMAVEERPLRAFAKATRQRDPVYLDPAAARAAGYPGLPVPPTYLFCLEMEGQDGARIRRLLDIGAAAVLHGEQSFDYHAMAFAGERLRFQARITDIYDKKGGLLEFFVKETRVDNAAGARVAVLKSVSVVRHG